MGPHLRRASADPWLRRRSRGLPAADARLQQPEQEASGLALTMVELRRSHQSSSHHLSELRMCETSAAWDYLTPRKTLGGRRLTRPAVLAQVPSRWDG